MIQAVIGGIDGAKAGSQHNNSNGGGTFISRKTLLDRLTGLAAICRLSETQNHSECKKP